MNLLSEICNRAAAGADYALIEYDEIAAWPPDAEDALTSCGIVVPASPAVSIICDACEEGHSEVPEVAAVTPDGTERAYIPCPSFGRVAVDRTRLLRWRSDAGAIACTLGRLLHASGRPTELAGVGWRLGLVGVAGAQWQTIVVVNPAERISAKLRRFRRPLALVLDETLALDGVLVLPAARLLRIEDKALLCDWRYLESECASIAAPGAAEPENATPPPARGRPVGRGLGTLLDCWTTCHHLDAPYATIHDFYAAAERYLQSHPDVLSPLPPLASFTGRRSEGKAKRARTGHCTWVGCATAPEPSDLVSD